MKRDMDLVREILLAIEELDTDGVGCEERHLQRYLQEREYDNYDKIYGHCKMMHQADLIKFKLESGGEHFLEEPITILWEGREFLDDVRDQRVWGKVKEEIGNRSNISFETLKKLVTETSDESLRSQIKLRTETEYTDLLFECLTSYGKNREHISIAILTEGCA